MQMMATNVVTIRRCRALLVVSTVCLVATLAEAFAPVPIMIPIKQRHAVGSSSTSLSAIVDEVTEEMKVAMKAKDKIRLGTIRLMRSAFTNAAIDLKTEKLSDEQAQAALKRMAKARKEAIDMYEKAGATDRADAERAELDVISRWLPSMASEEQVREWVQEAIEVAGKVMGALMKAHKAEVDGALAQRIVKEELAAT